MELRLPRIDPALVWLGTAAGIALPLIYAAGWGLHQPNPANWLILYPYFITGLFAAWRRPRLAPARLLLAVGTCLLACGAVAYGLALAYKRRGEVPLFWLGNTVERFFELGAAAAFIALFAVFPDGFFQRRYERLVVRVAAVLVFVGPVLTLISSRRLSVDRFILWGKPKVESPVYVAPLAWTHWIPAPFYEDLLVFPLVAVVLVLLRFRRFGREERLQIAWPLGGLVLFALIPAIPFPGGQSVQLGLLAVLFSLFPVAVAIGLLRGHLFDIDVPARRFLLYGVAWLAIAAAAAAVAAAIAIWTDLPAEATAVAAVVVLLALQPARARLERAASSRIFGPEPSGYALLGQLGETLESAYDPNELLANLAATIRRGLGVSWVRIRYGDLVVADGIRPDRVAVPEATAAIATADDSLGSIECGPKSEAPFDEQDHELLATLGRQAALALENARLSGELTLRLSELRLQADELTSSRQRLVQAAEVERRRIERNIHDGIQQELVAVMARLGLARNQLARDPALAEATLADLHVETEAALEHLREFASGIHPAVLSDRGLIEAVEARLAALPLAATIDADRALRGRRYPEPVEGAAYFFVCESLANVLKHAAASRVVVSVASTAEQLSVEVADDGRGFDGEPASGSGLRGLRDRIEALAGRLEVRSVPGEGTRLAATLPIGEANGH